jgi:hypothetical protein
MGSLYPGQDPPAPQPIKAARWAEAAEETLGDGSMACATLQGEAVVNRAGEELGSLEHVVIDWASGAISYGVLVRGGVFGLGERLHAFRWSALRFEPQRRGFVLDVDKALLDAAQGFDDEHWPAMNVAAWDCAADSIHKHRPV